MIQWFDLQMGNLNVFFYLELSYRFVYLYNFISFYNVSCLPDRILPKYTKWTAYIQYIPRTQYYPHSMANSSEKYLVPRLISRAGSKSTIDLKMNVQLDYFHFFTLPCNTRKPLSLLKYQVFLLFLYYVLLIIMVNLGGTTLSSSTFFCKGPRLGPLGPDPIGDRPQKNKTLCPPSPPPPPRVSETPPQRSIPHKKVSL